MLVVADGAVDALVAGLGSAGLVAVPAPLPRAASEVLGGAVDAAVLELASVEEAFPTLDALRGRSEVPVLVLAPSPDVAPRLEAFARGAADVVPTPFDPSEVAARVRARLGPGARRRVAWGDVVVDRQERRVTVAGADAGLTPREFAMLDALVLRLGRAVSRETLREGLASAGGTGERTVDSHVGRLRRKLGAGGAAIRSVWGVGYRFDPTEDGTSA